VAIAFGHKLGEDMSYGGGFLEGWTTRSFGIAAPGVSAGDFIWTPALGDGASVSNTEHLEDPSDTPKGPPFGIYDSQGQQYSVSHPETLNPDLSDANLQGGVSDVALTTSDTITAYFAVTSLGNKRKAVHGYRFTGLGSNPIAVEGTGVPDGVTIPDNDEWLVLYHWFDTSTDVLPAEDGAWNTLTRHGTSSLYPSNEYLAYKIVSSAAGLIGPPSGASGFMWALKPSPEETAGHTERRKTEPVAVDGIKELPVHITEDITKDPQALALGLGMNFDHISGQLRALQRTAQRLADELGRRPIDEEVDDIASESP
jgi:hypothetical protein